MTDYRERLLALGDEKNAAFVAKLIPTVPPERILGVRTPALRQLAKELARTTDTTPFLGTLPHFYLEENGLHAFLIEQIRDFDRCMEELERFLPFVDNWATCDSLSPGVFRKRRAELRERIRFWIASDRTYTIRFGVRMLMDHFLDGEFDPAYPGWVAGIRSEEYYVNMMRAWYFATALAKQYEAVLPILEERRLDPWTHNKTIRKAIESYRVPAERKALLRELTVKQER